MCFAFLSTTSPLVFVLLPSSSRPLNTRRDFHNLGRGVLAPPYNIIIYVGEGSLIFAPRGCKMADHVNAPLIFRDLARLPPASEPKHLSAATRRSLLKSTLLLLLK